MACRLSYFQYMKCSQIVICMYSTYMDGDVYGDAYGPLESVLTLCYAPHCSSLTNAVLSPDIPAHSRHCSVTYRRGHARCCHPSVSAVPASSAAIHGMSLIKKKKKQGISINLVCLSLTQHTVEREKGNEAALRCELHAKCAQQGNFIILLFFYYSNVFLYCF